MGHMPLKRSTVIWISVLPQPRISMNCLGRPGVLRGQKRLPIPPAIITIWLFLIYFAYPYSFRLLSLHFTQADVDAREEARKRA